MMGYDMERLTEKHSAGYGLKATNDEWCNTYCEKQSVATCIDCGIYQAIQKLAYYEDLEEQGRLITLTIQDIHPCKHCDTGWGCISSEGCTSCYDTCERLKRYNEKYNR